MTNLPRCAICNTLQHPPMVLPGDEAKQFLADHPLTGGQLVFRWTDTNGIAACMGCGAPYRLETEKPPEIMIRAAWLPLYKRYWQETKRNCDPGAFNLPGSRYEVATREDFEAHHRWMLAHEADWPDEPESEEVA